MEIERLEECAKSSLVTAIHDGRLDEVKELVPLSNLSKQEQFYCLFNALFYDQRAITTYLLQKGFKFVNPRDKSSSTPFRLAVFNPNIELIDMLLKNTLHHSHYPNRTPYVDSSSCSASPLLFLAFRGRANEKFIQFFESLLSQTDADLGQLLKTPLTPDAQQPAILLQTFIEYSSAVIKISDFSSLLYLAFSRGNEIIVRLLLHRIRADDLLDLLETLLTDTAFDDWRPQLFQAILEYGSADFKFVGEKFVKPLFEILNRCVVVYPHIHLLSNCPLSRVFNEKDAGTAEVLAKHVIKLKTAGLYKEQLPVNCNTETMCNFQRRCEEEVADMKSECVGESSVYFHDVLTQDLNRLALMTRNDQVERVLGSSYVEARFPIYSSLIRNQFEKGTIRRMLLEVGIKSCNSLLGCFSDLPYELIEKIFGYLDNVDLRVMVYPRGPVGKGDSSKAQFSKDHS